MYELLSKHQWHIKHPSNTFYAATHYKSKYISMHSMIMKHTPNNTCIDHIDHNGLNNRLSNLRIATINQNAMNCKVYITNKIGIAGVNYTKVRNKYHADIKYKNIKLNLGYYKSLDEAVYVRVFVEKLLFLEYRCIKDDVYKDNLINKLTVDQKANFNEYVINRVIKLKTRIYENSRHAI